MKKIHAIILQGLLCLQVPESAALSSAAEERKTILVKIGGSAITDKANWETLNETNIQWFSQTLAANWSSSGGGTCSNSWNYVVVHGAGSFGHHTAKEFDIKAPTGPVNNAGSRAQPHQMKGLSHTRISVQTLNRYVVRSLIDHNVSAVGISPCFGILNMEPDVAGLDNLASTVERTLAAGLVPVLHGDACLHGKHGAGILGGDTLMKLLGSSIDFSRVVFITDVDGVYTADPRVDKKAQLIPIVEIGANGKMLTNLQATGSRHEHDVTGGLETKLGAAISIAQTGKEVMIVKFGTKSAEHALQGHGTINGTVVRKRL